MASMAERSLLRAKSIGPLTDVWGMRCALNSATRFSLCSILNTSTTTTSWQCQTGQSRNLNHQAYDQQVQPLPRSLPGSPWPFRCGSKRQVSPLVPENRSAPVGPAPTALAGKWLRGLAHLRIKLVADLDDGVHR